jgi:hypothetical protein
MCTLVFEEEETIILCVDEKCVYLLYFDDWTISKRGMMWYVYFGGSPQDVLVITLSSRTIG